MADGRAPACGALGASQPQPAVGDWLLERQIGKGSFAVVWQARHRATGAEAAVKEISTANLNKKLRLSLESEVSILKQIAHKNIVQLRDVLEERNRLFLVMEYCQGGDLAGYIRQHRRASEATARNLLGQLAAGLHKLWMLNLVHRDLKPQNLLLSDNSPGAVLKIADFGFARNLQPQGLAETLCGSPLYMAPEILSFHKYDAKADLWSVGAILFELLAGRPPFSGANHMALLRNIERSEARLPDALAAELSGPCRALLGGLLRRNPVERLSWEEFFAHPFLASSGAPQAALVTNSLMWNTQQPYREPVTTLGGPAALQPLPTAFALACGPLLGDSAALLESRSLSLRACAEEPAPAPQHPHGIADRAEWPGEVAAERHTRGPGPQGTSLARGGGHEAALPLKAGSSACGGKEALPVSSGAYRGASGEWSPGHAGRTATLGVMDTGSSSADSHVDEDDYVIIDGPASSHGSYRSVGRPGPVAYLPAYPQHRRPQRRTPQAAAPPVAPGHHPTAPAEHPGPGSSVHLMRALHALHAPSLTLVPQRHAVPPLVHPGHAVSSRPPLPPAPADVGVSLPLAQALAPSLHTAAAMAHASPPLPAPRYTAAQPEGLVLGAAAAQLTSAPGGGEGTVAVHAPAAARIAKEMRAIAARAEAVAAAANAALAHASGGGPGNARALPDAWTLAYGGALAAARAAAVDELMGNVEAGLRGYALAALVLGFMAGEAGGLQGEARLVLPPPERARLARYAAEAAKRFDAAAATRPPPSSMAATTLAARPAPPNARGGGVPAHGRHATAQATAELGMPVVGQLAEGLRAGGRVVSLVGHADSGHARHWAAGPCVG